MELIIDIYLAIVALGYLGTILNAFDGDFKTKKQFVKTVAGVTVWPAVVIGYIIYSIYTWWAKLPDE